VSRVSFTGVTKQFGTTTALQRFDLEVASGELLVLLGPSGCGKTTALRILAGLEEPTAGDVTIGDRVVTALEPKDRDIAMVFQSYALYPHMTVRKNVEFPLANGGVGKAEMATRVDEALATVALTELADRKPGQLSGGQRQRVALARAIVRRPQVFLMDEPLSNLDATLRLQTRADIVDLQKRLGVTTVYVTHDQVEAMTMGDRIAVMNHGVLQQIGRPIDCYNQPANAFVAAFLGSPGMNLVTGQVRDSQIVIGGVSVASTDEAPRESVTVGLRAEHLALAPGGFPVTVVIVEDLGADVLVVGRTAAGERVVVKQSTTAPRPAAGTTVHVAVSGPVHLFDVTSGERVSA
jgi:multiple sugar transport system ATP-binding protein